MLPSLSSLSSLNILRPLFFPVSQNKKPPPPPLPQALSGCGTWNTNKKNCSTSSSSSSSPSLLISALSCAAFAVMRSTVMHAEHSKGSCSPVIPCHWRLEFQKWWLRGKRGGVLGEGRGGQRTKKDLVACKEVRIYWMLERCAGEDHAHEEKCQTVLDQADQRHFGTRITEHLQLESSWKNDRNAKMPLEPSALLFFFICCCCCCCLV